LWGMFKQRQLSRRRGIVENVQITPNKPPEGNFGEYPREGGQGKNRTRRRSFTLIYRESATLCNYAPCELYVYRYYAAFRFFVKIFLR
jgi:hypothetical protein